MVDKDKIIENKLIEISNEFYKLSLAITRNQESVNLANLNNLLNEMNGIKDDYEETLIPMNMIDVVDAGVNPDQIQKQQIQTLVDKNQKLNGRLKSLKLLKDELESQVALNYPEIYKALMNDQ